MNFLIHDVDPYCILINLSPYNTNDELEFYITKERLNYIKDKEVLFSIPLEKDDRNKVDFELSVIVNAVEFLHVLDNLNTTFELEFDIDKPNKLRINERKVSIHVFGIL